jgi:hypothetical protein
MEGADSASYDNMRSCEAVISAITFVRKVASGIMLNSSWHTPGIFPSIEPDMPVPVLNFTFALLSIFLSLYLPAVGVLL